MDNQDELQELDLEAIMREFHDPSKDLPPEEPEAAESTEAAEEAPAEALADAGAEDVPAAPEVPEDETPVPDSMKELDIGIPPPPSALMIFPMFTLKLPKTVLPERNPPPKTAAKTRRSLPPSRKRNPFPSLPGPICGS